jgi:hypothetical protein
MTNHVESVGADADAATGRAATSSTPAPVAAARSVSASWLFRVVLEVLLISLGVFLALMGEQWRQHAEDRSRAQAALRRFQAEIQVNRGAVLAVKDYHQELLPQLRRYLEDDPRSRTTETVRIQGLRPVFFERTAWDLAIATQALAHIEPDIAFALSRAYGLQTTYAEMTRGIMQAVYQRPIDQNFDGLSDYYCDLVLWEPQLVQMYDELLRQLDTALADRSARSR